jgi:hypothetical protein
MILRNFHRFSGVRHERLNQNTSLYLTPIAAPPKTALKVELVKFTSVVVKLTRCYCKMT